MQVILIEKVEKFGAIGDIVNVKNGFARNFLFPRNKAVRATQENIAQVEKRKAELEAANEAKKQEALKVLKKIDNLNVNLIRQAADDGRLYGSVTSKDIASSVNESVKTEVSGSMIVINSKFKEIGIYSVDVFLHPDVKATINLNIARSVEEAKVALTDSTKVVTKEATEAEPAITN